jgi:hypothetical protein
MIELLRLTDPVRLSFLRQALEAADIAVFVSDSGPWPGAIPVRLMVAAEDEELARRTIAEAEALVGGR